MIEREIDKLTEPHREYVSRENLQRGEDRPASEIARNWSDFGRPDFTACYLSIADDLKREEKTNILAYAYENKSKSQKTTGEFLKEKTGDDKGFLDQSRENLEKARALRNSLKQ